MCMGVSGHLTCRQSTTTPSNWSLAREDRRIARTNGSLNFSLRLCPEKPQSAYTYTLHKYTYTTSHILYVITQLHSTWNKQVDADRQYHTHTSTLTCPYPALGHPLSQTWFLEGGVNDFLEVEDEHDDLSLCFLHRNNINQTGPAGPCRGERHNIIKLLMAIRTWAQS